MATYIVMIDFTEQGARNIKDSPNRELAFAEHAEQAGVTIKEVYWTFGERDGVLIIEGPDDRAMLSLLLSLAQAGNVKTHTLRAFDRSEMEALIAEAL